MDRPKKAYSYLSDYPSSFNRHAFNKTAKGFSIFLSHNQSAKKNLAVNIAQISYAACLILKSPRAQYKQIKSQ